MRLSVMSSWNVTFLCTDHIFVLGPHKKMYILLTEALNYHPELTDPYTSSLATLGP